MLTMLLVLAALNGDLPPPPLEDGRSGDLAFACQGERTVYNDGRDLAQWYSRREPWRGRLWVNNDQWRMDGMTASRPVASTSGSGAVLYDSGSSRMTLSVQGDRAVLRSTDRGRPNIEASCRPA